jgi:SAM-dependent methyltransferase
MTQDNAVTISVRGVSQVEKGMRAFKGLVALILWFLLYMLTTIFVFFVLIKDVLTADTRGEREPGKELRPSDALGEEKRTLLRFIERNLEVASRDLHDLDEGIGTVYERVVIDDYFRRLQAERDIHTVLEIPADGVTGVPGINSLEFARNGGTVWLANPSQKMLDRARHVWQQQGLVDHVRLTYCEVDDIPFDDEAFDLVWNYCMFERFRDPASLVAEMKRISRRYVLIMTQNLHNSGTPVHKVYHAIFNLKWDHGYDRQMTFAAIRQAVLAQGLHIEEEGSIDIPPWMDTWDMPLRGVLKQLLAVFDKKWEWRIETLGTSENGATLWMMNFLRGLEANLPEWFRRFQAHHLYVLAWR